MKNWLKYPSIKRIEVYLAAKNGGYEYLSMVSLLKSYVEPVYYFAKFLGYDDPESLLQDIKSGRVSVEDAIVSWRMKLLADKKAPKSLIRYNNGVKRWLSVNGVKVNWEEINNKIPLPKGREIVEDRIPTRDELKMLLARANLRMKAIIEIAVSSGMRIGNILNLKVGDLDLDSDPKIGIIRVRPELSKNRVGYYALITPEAKQILKQYLSTRGDLSPDSWLFPSWKDPSKPMTYKAFQLAWSRLLKKVGLNVKSRKGGFYQLHVHVLRKYFRTMLEGYLTKSQIERLMGHLKTEYLDGSYFKPPDQELITAYKKAMHRLMILKDTASEEERKRQLLLTAKLLGLPDDKIKKIEEILSRPITIEEAVEEIRGLIQGAKEDYMTNGGARRIKIVRSDEELIHHLERGWRIVRELRDGRIILER